MVTLLHLTLFAGHAAPLLPAASAQVVSALCSAVWEGALLAACVAICLRLMPGLSAAARSAVWMNVFALVAALHLVPMLEGRGAIAGGLVSRGALIHPIQLDPRWSLAIAAAWAALSAWRGAELVGSAISLHRVARRAKPVEVQDELRALLNGARLGGRRLRSAGLCTSTEVERPSFFGFFRPRILIPEGLLKSLSALELRQVVLHEMEHLRRYDDWKNLAQKIGLALFPLNPALLWVERRLCTERELACDNRVLRASAERKTYALCLTRVAEFSVLNRGLSLALGAWGRRPELARRVHRILRRPAREHTGRKARLAPAALTLAALGCAVALARSPQMVSFTPRLHRAAAVARMETAAAAANGIQANARMEPAKPAATKAAGAVMVKVVLPRRQRTRMRAALAHMKRMTPESELVKTTARMQRLPEWVVMTEWQRIEVPQLVITVQETVQQDPRSSGTGYSSTRSSYAAVPFANGWLIVQI